jgi:6-phosphogluconate dehydrogenase
VEKPFGNDAETARELDELLCSLFREEQIYRIDHYLAKEMLQGIVNFRFANNLFEFVWNRDTIESIEVSLNETLGVEDRGAFYDGVGALRDVGQNHCLQMLALVTMDQPVSLEADAIRTKRAQLLETVKRPTEIEVAQDTFRAQYDGYRDIEGVAPDSDTDTYFKIKTVLQSPRWRSVPITLEGGKRISDGNKEIVVNFRHPQPCLCGPEGHHMNRVVFKLAPEESIAIEFWTKKPGFENELEKREFAFFLYEKTEKLQYVEEYSKLLLDAVRGDQTLFVSTDEVQAMWDFVDPIETAWHQGAVPLETYVPDTEEAPRKAERVNVESVRVVAMRREIAVVGLGKMGAGLARNLLDHGWRVVGWNRTASVAEGMAPDGLEVAYSPREVVEKLTPPRIVWLMLPAGKITDEAVFGEEGYASLLSENDILIDGANSFFRDDLARVGRLKERGIRYLDVGVSGGPGGARYGACLMVGGDATTFGELEMLWSDLSVEGGYAHFDGVGAGHFVKMVHNGIEYGMMQAIAEGFAIMREAELDIDLVGAAEVFNHGSVIESSLVGWLKDGYETYGVSLDGISGTVAHTGEGEWTVQVARDMGVPAPVIETSFLFRVESEQDPSYTGQVLSVLRNMFGGHKAT